MGNHTIGRSIGLAAQEAVRNRMNNEAALSILDRLCAPFKGTDAEWEAFDPKNPGRIHPEFSNFTDPHPNAALGMLMVEAFAPNGLADLPRYQYMVPSLRSGGDYDVDLDEAAVDAWWKEVYEPLKKRYGFW